MAFFPGMIKHKVMKRILIYHAIVYSLFVSIYWLMDFPKHFALPEGSKGDLHDIFYFAIVTQMAVSPPGDMAPLTKFARGVTALHALASWFQMISLIVVFPLVKSFKPW
jgi:hypothetical protein